MPALAARTEPPVVTLRSEPEEMLEIAKDVVVALVSVAFVEKRLSAVRAVEDAYVRTELDAARDNEEPLSQISVEVEFAN